MYSKLRDNALIAALAIDIFALSAAAAVADPGIAVSPKAAPPTETVAVSGSGFAAFEAIDIYFDTTDLQLAVAGGDGNFSQRRINVPSSALPGRHWVTAVGRQSKTGAQHSLQVRTNWAEFGFALRGGRNNLYENVLTPANVASLNTLWRASAGGGSPPAVADGAVYVGSGDRKVYAFDEDTGRKLWTARTEAYLTSPPAVANGVVYVGSEDNRLYAFGSKMGNKLWTGVTGGPVLAPPVVANGVVYVGSYDGNLYAFDAETGRRRWVAPTPTGSSVWSSPAVANGVVYVESVETVAAFDANTGRALWANEVLGSSSSPAVANGVVYVGSGDYNLYAFDANTGIKLWSAATKSYVISSPAVANGVVYVGSHDGNLYAFDATTSRKLWETATGGPVDSSPAVANGLVYVGSGVDNVYGFSLNAFDAKTGNRLWRAATPSATSPAVANGAVYFGSFDGDVYAFSLNGQHYASAQESPAPRQLALRPDYTLSPTP